MPELKKLFQERKPILKMYAVVKLCIFLGMSQHQLPLFPLSLVVFPGEALNLHIFESRYQQLIQDCETNGTDFGIVTYHEGRIKTYGTVVKLEKIAKKYPDGKSDIKTLGGKRFKLKEFWPTFNDKLYGGGLIEPVETDWDEDPSLNLDIIGLIQQLFSLLRIKKTFPTDPTTFKTFDIAHYIGLNIDEEYELLILPTAIKRQQFLLDHLHRILPIVLATEQLKDKARLNGHFKHLKPPKI